MGSRISSGEQSYLVGHPGIQIAAFVIIKPKTFVTAIETPICWWTGPYDAAFNLDGVSRTFVGSRGLLSVDLAPMVYGLGFGVNTWQFGVGIADEDTDAEIRGYDYRLAPVEVYRGIFDGLTNTLVETPHRMLKGRAQSAPIVESEDGSVKCMFTVSTAAIDLTRNMPDKMGDAFLRTRAPTDSFFQYTAVSGTFPQKWGTG